MPASQRPGWRFVLLNGWPGAARLCTAGSGWMMLIVLLGHGQSWRREGETDGKGKRT
jgi:hypothetical protein